MFIAIPRNVRDYTEFSGKIQYRQHQNKGLALANGQQMLYFDGKPLAIRNRETCYRTTVHRVELEPSSVPSLSGIETVIFKQQKDGWEREFQDEVIAYEKLKDLQGVVVPRLLGQGSLDGLPALILSEVPGTPIQDIAYDWQMIDENLLGKQLTKVLRILYDHGAEYYDFKLDNFLLCADTARYGLLILSKFGFPTTFALGENVLTFLASIP